MAPADGRVDGAWAGVLLVLVALIIGTIVAGLYASASNRPLTDQLQQVSYPHDGGVR